MSAFFLFLPCHFHHSHHHHRTRRNAKVGHVPGVPREHGGDSGGGAGEDAAEQGHDMPAISGVAIGESVMCMCIYISMIYGVSIYPI